MRYSPLLASALVLLPTSALSNVAFSNFGPGMTWGTGGWLISGLSTISGGSIAASRFTSGLTGNLSSLNVALSHDSGVPNELFVKLYAANGAGQIGNLIESWSATSLEPLSNGGELVTLSSQSATHLVAGTDYWISIWPGGSNTEGAWLWPVDQNQYLPFAYSVNGGSSFQYIGDSLPGTFQVNVVPEPATIATVFLGVSWIARKRKSERAKSE